MVLLVDGAEDENCNGSLTFNLQSDFPLEDIESSSRAGHVPLLTQET